jgi:hypothetical protein
MTRFIRLAVYAIVLAGFVPMSQGSLITYHANLDGLSEAPPNASPGTGVADVSYDDVAHTLRVQVSFSGLLGTVTASHIHAATASPGIGTAGVATTTPTFAGFPSGVTSGVYDNTLNLILASSWNASYITAHGGTTAGAEAALAAALAADKAYLNIHTNAFPGGEIRGFLVPVPEPVTVGLLGFAALFIRRRPGQNHGISRSRRAS